MPVPPITPLQLTELHTEAERAAQNAYAPYSRFYVGAALLLTTGEIVSGCNVENASYRLTSCAEQGAIARAVASFGPAIRIAAVAVHNRNRTACQPCGACRQTIAEFADPGALVLYPGEGNELLTSTVAALLPGAFKLQS